MRKVIGVFTILSFLSLPLFVFAQDTTQYKISDIQYKLKRNKPGLFMTIENVGETPVKNISFRCIINGQEVVGYSYASFYGVLKPKEVSRDFFNLMYCYKDYLINQLKSDNPLPLYELDVQLMTDDNTILFKKHISIKDLKASLIKNEQDGFVSYNLSLGVMKQGKTLSK